MCDISDYTLKWWGIFDRRFGECSTGVDMLWVMLAGDYSSGKQ
jgi:hypothetical protein